MNETRKPTPTELAILKALWDHGPSTVRQIQENLQDPTTGYTTVLKMVQIMITKGLVVRDETQRAHVYSARDRQEQVQRQLLGDLMDRAFGGSAAKLVLQALSTKPATPEELAEIRSLLREIEETPDAV